MRQSRKDGVAVVVGHIYESGLQFAGQGHDGITLVPKIKTDICRDLIIAAAGRMDPGASVAQGGDQGSVVQRSAVNLKIKKIRFSLDFGWL